LLVLVEPDQQALQLMQLLEAILLFQRLFQRVVGVVELFRPRPTVLLVVLVAALVKMPGLQAQVGLVQQIRGMPVGTTRKVAMTEVAEVEVLVLLALTERQLLEVMVVQG